jgi:hypothetical protein
MTKLQCAANPRQEAVGPHIPSAAVLIAYLARLGSVLVVGFIVLDTSNDPTLLNA